MVSVKHLVSLLIFEVVAILPIFLVLYWAQKYAGGFSWETGNKLKFNYHPVFMVIGFIFVMGHGLITFRILPVSHRIKKYIHATINITAAIFAILGLVAVLEFHNENKIPNFYSLHSWLGITTIALLLLQALGGLAIFQDLLKGASTEVRGFYKPYHVALGVSMVTLATVCACTGLQEKYGFANPVKFSAEAYSFNFLGLSLLLWAFTVIYILLFVDKRIPEPPAEDETPLTGPSDGGYQTIDDAASSQEANS